MSIRYILGSDSLTAFVGGKPYTINRSAEIFDKVLEAVRNDDEQAFKNLVEIKSTIVNMFGDNKELEIKSNRLYCNGREITGLIATRVLEMLKFKLDIA